MQDAQSFDNALDAQLQVATKDASYEIIHTFKESDWGRTELVRDAKGTKYVRKYLLDEAGFGAGYRALANLHTPAFPTLIDEYHLDGYDVVILEYVPGQTLREYIEAFGSLNEAQALSFVRILAHGVAQLHVMTPTPIVHRDITPGNIVVSAHGPVLIDFGIARAFKETAHRDTRTWGTHGYAAPEQFGFGQSGPYSDVYALGMVLAYCLTGEDPVSDMQDRITDDPRVSEPMRRIIRACISLDPHIRPQNAAELEKLLDAVVGAQKFSGSDLQGYSQDFAAGSGASDGVSEGPGQKGFAISDGASAGLSQRGLVAVSPDSTQANAYVISQHVNQHEQARGYNGVDNGGGFAPGGYRGKGIARDTSAASTISTAFQSIVSHIKSDRVQRIALYVWRAALIITCALMALGGASKTAEYAAQFPTDTSWYGVAAFAVLAGWFVLPAIFLGNFFGLLSKDSPLGKHQIIKAILIVVLGLLLAAIIDALAMGQTSQVFQAAVAAA